MRMTQIFGLPPKARQFIIKNAKVEPELVCPKCKTIVTNKISRSIWKDASDYGMFDDGPKLRQYILKDKKKVREEIQACPWSSGPCIFLMLVDENKKTLFKWNKKEIDNC